MPGSPRPPRMHPARHYGDQQGVATCPPTMSHRTHRTHPYSDREEAERCQVHLGPHVCTPPATTATGRALPHARPRCHTAPTAHIRTATVRKLKDARLPPAPTHAPARHYGDQQGAATCPPTMSHRPHRTYPYSDREEADKCHAHLGPHACARPPLRRSAGRRHLPTHCLASRMSHRAHRAHPYSDREEAERCQAHPGPHACTPPATTAINRVSPPAHPRCHTAPTAHIRTATVRKLKDARLPPAPTYAPRPPLRRSAGCRHMPAHCLASRMSHRTHRTHPYSDREEADKCHAHHGLPNARHSAPTATHSTARTCSASISTIMPAPLSPCARRHNNSKGGINTTKYTIANANATVSE